MIKITILHLGEGPGRNNRWTFLKGFHRSGNTVLPTIPGCEEFENFVYRGEILEIAAEVLPHGRVTGGPETRLQVCQPSREEPAHYLVWLVTGAVRVISEYGIYSYTKIAEDAWVCVVEVGFELLASITFEMQEVKKVTYTISSIAGGIQVTEESSSKVYV